MSSKTKLKNEMRAASARAGGSHATRRARDHFISLLVTTLFLLGFPVASIDQIGVRAIKAFLDFRKKAGKQIRTIQNDMSFIRTILCKSGREQFARDPLLKNSALGIEGASRRGTKVPPSDEELEELLRRVRDPGLCALLLLARYLGLRAEEAVLSIRSMQGWAKALLNGQVNLMVIWGTKGGRPRLVRVFDRDNALWTVECALAVLASGRKLAPKPNLRKALKWFSNATSSLGIQAHALRYKYCEDAIYQLQKEGHTEQEAYALAGMYLGHSDSRGRMVKCVYGNCRLTKLAMTAG